MNDNTFNGTAVIVWFSDGKMKHKTVRDESQFKKELEAIEERVPRRCIFPFAINWDEKEVMILDSEQEELKS